MQKKRTEEPTMVQSYGDVCHAKILFDHKNTHFIFPQIAEAAADRATVELAH